MVHTGKIKHGRRKGALLEDAKCVLLSIPFLKISGRNNDDPWQLDILQLQPLGTQFKLDILQLQSVDRWTFFNFKFNIVFSIDSDEAVLVPCTIL
jgi:hypothetical protein